MPEIRFLTYNIMLKPSQLFILNNDFKAERYKLFCSQYLKNYDIVCLQETFDAYHSIVSNLLEEAEQMGFEYMTKSSIPPIFSTYSFQGGLTILSKYKILDSEEMIFPPGTGLDRTCTKGALYAKIHVQDGKILHVVNLHDQAHFTHHGEENVYLYKFLRLKQLAKLKEFIAKIISEKYNQGDLFLLSGDFNVDWNEEDFYRDYEKILSKFHSISDGLKSNFTNEYDLLMQLFNWNNHLFRLKNVYLDQNGKQAITFSDYTIDENGKKIPKVV